MYVESKFSFLLISSHNNLVPYCQIHSLSVCVGGTEVQGKLPQSTKTGPRENRPGCQGLLEAFLPKYLRRLQCWRLSGHVALPQYNLEASVTQKSLAHNP